MDSSERRSETLTPVRSRTRRFPTFVVVGGALVAACSSSSKDATGPGPAAVITANSATAQTGLTGQAVSTKPSVKVTDATGDPVSGVSVTFTVTGGGGSLTGATQTTNLSGVATVGSWTLGSTPGANTVTATAAGVPGNVVFSAAGGSVASNFTIQLQYLQVPSTAQANAFTAAASRWSQAITGDLGAVNVAPTTTPSWCGSAAISGTVDDILIIVDLKAYDGPGKVLGAASICAIRDAGDPSTNLPLVGYMFFDTADLANIQASGALNDVILHEMGHVLGFGTRWEPSPWNFIATTAPTTGSTLGFNGPNGVSAYANSNGGSGLVPVEDTAVAGTGRSHWKESVLKNELMTGYLSGTTRPLSATTIASLADFGYTVNLAAADAYNVQTAGLRAEAVSGPVFDLSNDIIRGEPLLINTATGRVVPRPAQ
jgi:hypothetical protein